jgi:hypothetical protein
MLDDRETVYDPQVPKQYHPIVIYSCHDRGVRMQV